MRHLDPILRVSLLVIAGSLGMIATRPFFDSSTALAQSARFDHVNIISAVFLYKGQQGILVLDRRNANVWFIPKRDEAYQNPVFVTKLPFENLDRAPQ
jgi:hypothetical protein